MPSRVNAARCGFPRNMPIPSSLYDALQRGIPRLPAEEIFGFVRIGDEFRRVAGAPLHFSDWHSASTHVFDSRNHLANGMTTPRAKVNGSILVALKHVPEGRNVRLGQVHYIGIVADGSAVRSGVIRPIYLELRLLSQR